MAHEATVRGIGVGVGAGGAGAPAVLLEARDEFVPIFISPGQARVIDYGHRGVATERPLTHDLFVGVLDDLGSTLDRVRIDDIEDGTFYAKLDITLDRGDGEETFVRDARPSDGIALAVRVGCPITVADAVIDEAGRELDHRPVDFDTGVPTGTRMDVGLGSDPSDVGTREKDSSVELDEGVDIEFEESDDANDDESES